MKIVLTAPCIKYNCKYYHQRKDKKCHSPELECKRWDKFIDKCIDRRIKSKAKK